MADACIRCAEMAQHGGKRDNQQLLSTIPTSPESIRATTMTGKGHNKDIFLNGLLSGIHAAQSYSNSEGNPLGKQHSPWIWKLPLQPDVCICGQAKETAVVMEGRDDDGVTV